VFERYTEAASRLIFHARNEAAQCGSLIVETEHFLLALLKEEDSVLRRLLPPREDAPASLENEVRASLPSGPARQEKDSALSHAMKRVLAYSAEAAEQLDHQRIDTGHCLIGLLREEKCLASQILERHGITRDKVLREIGGRELVPNASVNDSPPPVATRETLNALVASLPEGAIEHACRMLERMQVWPPVPPPRPPRPGFGGMGGGSSWMTDAEGRVRDGSFSSSRIEDGVRVSETRRFIEGHEINTLERVRVDQEKKLLSWSQRIRGPKREHHFDIDFEIE
jgi:Clp amino terminal domain, pathogenicity island component